MGVVFGVVELVEEDDELEELEEVEASMAWYKFILPEPPQYSVEFEKQVKVQPVAPLTAFDAKVSPQ